MSDSDEFWGESVHVEDMDPRPGAIDRARRWLAHDAVFLDMETTGLSETDEICEIAVIDAEGVALHRAAGDAELCRRVVRYMAETEV